MLNKDHHRILTAIKSGLALKWMGEAGSFFDNGFILIGENKGIKGFGEVKTSSVIYLERHGYLILNRYHTYVVTGKFKGE